MYIVWTFSLTKWVVLVLWCAAQGFATVSWAPSGRGNQPMASTGVTVQWSTGECTGAEGGEYAIQLHVGSHHHRYGSYSSNPAPLMVTSCHSHTPWSPLTSAAGLHADRDTGSKGLYHRDLTAQSAGDFYYTVDAQSVQAQRPEGARVKEAACLSEPQNI